MLYAFKIELKKVNYNIQKNKCFKRKRKKINMVKNEVYDTLTKKFKKVILILIKKIYLLYK